MKPSSHHRSTAKPAPPGAPDPEVLPVPRRNCGEAARSRPRALFFWGLAPASFYPGAVGTRGYPRGGKTATGRQRGARFVLVSWLNELVLSCFAHKAAVGDSRSGARPRVGVGAVQVAPGWSCAERTCPERARSLLPRGFGVTAVCPGSVLACSVQAEERSGFGACDSSALWPSCLPRVAGGRSRGTSRCRLGFPVKKKKKKGVDLVEWKQFQRSSS